MTTNACTSYSVGTRLLCSCTSYRSCVSCCRRWEDRENHHGDTDSCCCNWQKQLWWWENDLVEGVWWDAGRVTTVVMTNWMWCWRQSQVSCCSSAVTRQSGIFCLTCFLIVGTSSLFFGFEYAVNVLLEFKFEFVMCYMRKWEKVVLQLFLRGKSHFLIEHTSFWTMTLVV